MTRHKFASKNLLYFNRFKFFDSRSPAERFNFWELRKTHADLTIVFGKNKKKKRSTECHKIVLASASPFFREELDKLDKSDTPNVLALPDIKKQEFENILEFIYKGEVWIQVEEYERFVEIAKLLSVTGLKSYYDSSDPNAVEKRGRDEGKGFDEGQPLKEEDLYPKSKKQKVRKDSSESGLKN
jgi:hypothetical protein